MKVEEDLRDIISKKWKNGWKNGREINWWNLQVLGYLWTQEAQIPFFAT